MTSSTPTAITAITPCPLCDGPGGTLLATGNKLRVVRVSDPGFPVFYRVIWQLHVAEFSDLSVEERQECMDAVVCVERALLDHLPPEFRPDKINLAAFGNIAPHLHWHVIGRYRHDTHFPAAVWAAATRPVDTAFARGVLAALPAAESKMVEALEAAGLAHRPVVPGAPLPADL